MDIPRKAVLLHAMMFGAFKGLAMGTIALFVVANTDLSPFYRALIIAGVSAGIGAIGVIAAAWITSRHDQDRIEDMLRDLKAATGVTKRAGDPEPNGDNNGD